MVSVPLCGIKSEYLIRSISFTVLLGCNETHTSYGLYMLKEILAKIKTSQNKNNLYNTVTVERTSLDIIIIIMISI